MARPKPSRARRDISPTHQGAAGIDIGATMHVAAVGPEQDPEPVRGFGTFTGDLHRLADWFKHCGVRTVAMESTGVLLDSNLRDSRPARLRGRTGQRSGCQARSRPQDRHQRRSMAAAAARIRSAQGQLPAERRDCNSTKLPASARTTAGLCRLAHPTHAEGAHANEPAAPSRGDRRHRRYRNDDHSRHHCRRAKS